jgi:phytoene dehydrogenase-like protein
MWYGNARENDMDFGQFCIMFRALYLEGMARPHAGIRLILKNLVRKFRSLGGELKLRSGVSRIQLDGDRATGVVLESGASLSARHVLSSAGVVETMRLCNTADHNLAPLAGQMSFVESISILDRPPNTIGCDDTIVFFNDSDKFHWQRPQGEVCDARTGVICSPNNFAYAPDDGPLADNVIRITALADFDAWRSLPLDAYAIEKARWYDRLAASAVRFVPDFRSRVIDTDMFTPLTVRRFTGHENGAIYGAPHKQLDGTTRYKNLYLCGTDQGYLGIVGALVSGVAMANRHCLQA